MPMFMTSITERNMMKKKRTMEKKITMKKMNIMNKCSIIKMLLECRYIGKLLQLKEVISILLMD
jgi:hypothetical protein